MASEGERLKKQNSR